MFEYLIIWHGPARPFGGIVSLVGWEFRRAYSIAGQPDMYMVFRRPDHGRI